MEPPVIGKIIEGEGYRDAIHVAIAPVIAAENIYPGDRIGLVPGRTDLATRSGSAKKIGIADPFLEQSVIGEGQKFYMLLCPGTVTSLRHIWAHPAFVFTPKEK